MLTWTPFHCEQKDRVYDSVMVFRLEFGRFGEYLIYAEDSLPALLIGKEHVKHVDIWRTHEQQGEVQGKQKQRKRRGTLKRQRIYICALRCI